MKHFGYFIAVSCLFFSLILAISLLSYNPQDISFIYQSSEPLVAKNILGSFGANICGFALYFMGFVSWGLVLISFFLGLILLSPIPKKRYLDRLIFCFLFILNLSAIFNISNIEYYESVYPGGTIGLYINKLIVVFLDRELLYLLLFTLSLCYSIIILRFKSIILLLNYISKYLLDPIAFVLSKINYLFCKAMIVIKDNAISLFREESYQEENLDNIEQVLKDIFWEDCKDRDSTCFSIKATEDISKNIIKDNNKNSLNRYRLPNIKLFNLPIEKNAIDEAVNQNDAFRIKTLEEKLSKFGIKGKVVSVIKGPIVSLFEYKPAIDTKISNIVSRQEDLALALQAHSLRIIAPIPGKDVIGFEISHQDRTVIDFGTICSNVDVRKYQLPLILGKDVIGKDIVIDLVAQPHLLVSGSTGSGKSVGLNCMINTILFYSNPEKVKLILIDPKRLEFISYQDIPHLLFPIITEANKAISALKWAVFTMEERYKILSESGARNIEEYNNLNLDHLDYIVIVIDELADLIMIAGKEIEYLLTRLAQMARAAGIHMIVATQRPSVDVITGVIKVNFPSRIAFKVISKIDSRTILDSVGAEKLLGKGDMLFLDTSGNIKRIHGAYIKNIDIENIAGFIKNQKKAEYIEFNYKKMLPFDQNTDEIYNDIIMFVKKQDEVSISQIQRVFKIGYNRSARIVDQLEQEGYVLPPGNGKMRRVVK